MGQVEPEEEIRVASEPAMGLQVELLLTHTEARMLRSPIKLSGPKSFSSDHIFSSAKAKGLLVEKQPFQLGTMDRRASSQPGDLLSSCINPTSLKNNDLLFSFFEKKRKISCALQG